MDLGRSEPGLFRRLLDRLAGDVEHEPVRTAACASEEAPYVPDLEPGLSKATLHAEALAQLDAPKAKANASSSFLEFNPLSLELKAEMAAILDQRLRAGVNRTDAAFLWNLPDHGVPILEAILFGDNKVSPEDRDTVLEEMPSLLGVQSLPVLAKIAASVESQHSYHSYHSELAFRRLTDMCLSSPHIAVKVIPALETIAMSARGKMALGATPDPLAFKTYQSACKALQSLQGMAKYAVEAHGHSWPADAATDAIKRVQLGRAEKERIRSIQ